jgi:hydrogenase maturation protease
LTRLLALGNELLADDAFAVRVAGEVRRIYGDQIDVVTVSLSGNQLIDYVVDADRLFVVRALVTGAPPGTIHELDDKGVRNAISTARQLGLKVPSEVTVLAVEAADLLTLGGPMHPSVAAAIPRVLDLLAKAMI